MCGLPVTPLETAAPAPQCDADIVAAILRECGREQSSLLGLVTRHLGPRAWRQQPGFRGGAPRSWVGRQVRHCVIALAYLLALLHRRSRLAR